MFRDNKETLVQKSSNDPLINDRMDYYNQLIQLHVFSKSTGMYYFWMH